MVLVTAQPSVIIVGGGAIGLACAWSLARRGARVTVLERFGHVHDRGSHSGYTRVIRQAYHEGSSYVPLIQQADAHWSAMQQRSGRSLLHRTGLLLFGPDGGRDMLAAIETCRECDLPHTLHDGIDARERWPFRMPDDWIACFDPSGGYLSVTACMDVMAEEAVQAGARLRYGVQVVGIDRGPRRGVRLSSGETLTADAIVLAAGAWLSTLVPSLKSVLTERRRILAWSTPAAEHRAALEAIPVWGALLDDGFYYGFPYNEEGIVGLKVAVHTSDTQPWLDRSVEADTVDRGAHARDLDPLRRVLDEHLPLGRGEFGATHACLYSCTPTWDFLIDRDPEDARVILAGGFSGHGFKFAPAVGDYVGGLLLDEGEVRGDLSLAAAVGAGGSPR
ncbi:MAG: N-methyl-L-tryptophan oxidase [Myxococcota bacterium]